MALDVARLRRPWARRLGPAWLGTAPLACLQVDGSLHLQSGRRRRPITPQSAGGGWAITKWARAPPNRTASRCPGCWTPLSAGTIHFRPSRSLGRGRFRQTSTGARSQACTHARMLTLTRTVHADSLTLRGCACTIVTPASFHCPLSPPKPRMPRPFRSLGQQWPPATRHALTASTRLHRAAPQKTHRIGMGRRTALAHALSCVSRGMPPAPSWALHGSRCRTARWAP